MSDSLYFFFWMPSMSLLKVGTLAKYDSIQSINQSIKRNKQQTIMANRTCQACEASVGSGEHAALAAERVPGLEGLADDLVDAAHGGRDGVPLA
jgi:hypothetical protein